MTRRTPVLHLISNLNVGGAERQLLTLLGAFDRDRFQHHVGLLFQTGFLAGELHEIDDLERVDLNFRHRTFVPSMMRLAGYMRSNQIEVVHAHLHRIAVYGRIAAKMAGVSATVYTEHSDISARSRWEHWLERALLPLTGMKVTVSPEQLRLTQVLEGFPAGKVRVIANSIDVDEFSPNRESRTRVRQELGLSEEHLLVGVVGNLHERKRVDLLLEHLNALKERFEGMRLLVVGDGVDRPMLEEMSRTLGVEGRALFVGSQARVAPYMQAMDVLAISSRWEGLPINMLEAMACELPIVATDVGDIRRVVESADAGRVTGADDFLSYQRELVAILGDCDLRARLGKNARAYAVREHGARQNAARLEAIYRDLLGLDSEEAVAV